MTPHDTRFPRRAFGQGAELATYLSKNSTGAIDPRIAAVLELLEPEVLAMCITQELPLFFIKDPELLERMWSSGMLLAVVEDKELLRTLLQSQLLCPMLEQGLFMKSRMPLFTQVCFVIPRSPGNGRGSGSTSGPEGRCALHSR